MADILKGKAVADALNEDIFRRAHALTTKGIQPTIGIIRVGEKGDDLAYEKGIVGSAEKVGIKVAKTLLEKDVPEEKVLAVIGEMNENPEIHGILVFRPLPSQIDDNKIRLAIKAEKDIDGITDLSMAGIYSDTSLGFVPCTPSAVVQVLKYYGIEIKGRNIVVVGRSLVVGKPVSMMLLKENATVTICHSKTEELAKVCRAADILIAAIGKAKFVKEEFTNPNQVIVDVGINMDENANLCGDVDFENVAKVCKAITPVPGGVGAVTSSILMEHVVKAAENGK